MSSRLAIKIVAAILLVAYLLIITKKIMFKQGGPRYYKHYFSNEYKNYSVSAGWRKANTVPFRTINMYKRGMDRNNSNAEYNLMGNFIGFIPFGILLPLFLPWFRNVFRMLLTGFLLTLGFETLQLLTGLGVWDVDDLLLNTAGALAGFVIFLIINTIVSLFNRKPLLQASR